MAYLNGRHLPEGWRNWSPTYSASGSMTFTSVSTAYSRYRIVGKSIEFEIEATGTTGGVAGTYIEFTLPVSPANVDSTATVFVTDGGNVGGFAFWATSNSRIWVARYDLANWGLGASRVIYVSGRHEIA